MFKEFAPEYFAKGIDVVPVRPGTKITHIENWRSVDFQDPQIMNQYAHWGVGLDLGINDVVVLDIDVEDSHQKKLIEEFLKDYPTPVMRSGNPKRLPSRFYARTWQQSKNKSGELELLSVPKDGMAICVLPPTKHNKIPDLNFSWATEKTLLNFPIEDLPPFPEEAWNKLVELFGSEKDKVEKFVTPSDGSRCAHGSHNQLSSMLSAAIMAGDTVDTIVKNLLVFDSKINPEISYFLCPERREFKTKDREFNCQKFVREGFDRHIRNGKIKKIPKEDVPFIVDIKPPKKPRPVKEKTYLKLPKLPGIGKEIFNDLYENSPIPRTQLCFMNTLNVVSMLIGNTVNLSGTYANLYLFGIAPSGFGKDFSFKRSIDYFDKCGLEKKLGSASPTSESQVLSLLEKRSTEQCMFVNEGESLLKRISSDRTNNGLRECLTDLYDMPGKSYVGKWLMNTNGKEFKAESIGKVYSPYVNMVILMTQRAFKDHVSMGFFETGLLSRPLFFFEDRFKRQKNLTRYNPPIPTDLIARMINFHNLGRKNIPEIIFSADAHFNALELQYEPDALDYLSKLHEAIEDQRELLIDDPFFGMLSRQLYLINKISLNHHAMLNEYDYTSKRVSLDSVKWSNDAVKSIMHNQRQFLCDQINSPYGAIRTDIEKFISSRDGVTISDIHQKFRQHQLAIRKAVVQDLKESGVIMALNNKIYRA